MYNKNNVIMKKFVLIGVALIATMSLFSLTSCSKDGTGDNDGDGYYPSSIGGG